MIRSKSNTNNREARLPKFTKIVDYGK